MDKLFNWIDDRTGYRSVLHALLLLNFPVNRAAHWRYVWGGSLAMLFLVQLFTGTLLMTVYSPSETSAWGSVQYIQTQVHWGWFIRGLHHYAAHMMLVGIILHTLTVVVTAGYRKPKEFTFWTGLLLAGVVLALAVSGNPLPWDQKGYWDYQIETSIIGTMPVVGSALKTLLVGGSHFGNATLTRLYTLHVVVLPVAAVLLLIIHIALMRREKLLIVKSSGLTVEEAERSGRMEPYWPFQTSRNLIVFALLMIVVLCQIRLYPVLKEIFVAPTTVEWEADVPISEIIFEVPADRDIPYVARPEWYVRFLYELRHMVPKDREILVTGVLQVVLAFLLFLTPFYERILGRRMGYTFIVLLYLSATGAVGWLTYDGINRDRHDSEFQTMRRREIDYAGRAMWLARAHGIPPEGPTALLHNDSKAMGPLLFAANCATCHSWNGHDGTGKIVMQNKDGKQVPAVPIAADLSGFGSQNWIAGFLANPSAAQYFGHARKLKDDSEMISWAEDNLAPNGPLTDRHLNAVAALVAREAARIDSSPADEKTLKLGKAIFSGENLKDKSGKPLEFDGNCLQCHQLKAGDPNGEGEGGDAPDLNGYASRRWLMDFIRNPAAEKFYGENNSMLAFDKTRISDRDLGLLVDWIRGEWANAKSSQKPKP